MSDYDFGGLTPRQQELLTFRGWYPGDSCPQPSARTAKKLIERGLVVTHKHVTPTLTGPITFLEYEVPLAVHMAWCAWCSEREARGSRKHRNAKQETK